MSTRILGGIFCSAIVGIVSIILLATASSKTEQTTTVVETYTTSKPITAQNETISAGHNPYNDTYSYYGSTKESYFNVTTYNQT